MHQYQGGESRDDEPYFLVVVPICYGKQSLGQQHLQFLDEEIFRVVDAHESADHVARPVRPEV